MQTYNNKSYVRKIKKFTDKKLREEYFSVCRNIIPYDLERKGDLCIFCNKVKPGAQAVLCLKCQCYVDHEECIYEDTEDAQYSEYYCPKCAPEMHNESPGPGMKKLMGITDEKEDEYVPPNIADEIDSDDIDHITTIDFGKKRQHLTNNSTGKVKSTNLDFSEFTVNDHMEMVDSEEERTKNGPFANLTNDGLVKTIVETEKDLQRIELEKKHNMEIERISGEKRNLSYMNDALKKEVERLREKGRHKDSEISSLRKRLQSLQSQRPQVEHARKRPRVERIDTPPRSWAPASPRENVSSPKYRDDIECYKCNRSSGDLRVCIKCKKTAIHLQCARDGYVPKDWECVDCRPDFTTSRTITSTMGGETDKQ